MTNHSLEEIEERNARVMPCKIDSLTTRKLHAANQHPVDCCCRLLAIHLQTESWTSWCLDAKCRSSTTCGITSHFESYWMLWKAKAWWRYLTFALWPIVGCWKAIRICHGQIDVVSGLAVLVEGTTTIAGIDYCWASLKQWLDWKIKNEKEIWASSSSSRGGGCWGHCGWTAAFAASCCLAWSSWKWFESSTRLHTPFPCWRRSFVIHARKGKERQVIDAVILSISSQTAALWHMNLHY